MTDDSGNVTGDSGKLPKIGHDKTECAVTIIQNRRSRSNGMGGHDRAEYATLTSHDEVYVFEAQDNVDSTPQVYAGDQRIGGYEALCEHLGMSIPNSKGTNYRPLLAFFATAILIKFAIGWIALKACFSRRAYP